MTLLEDPPTSRRRPGPDPSDDTALETDLESLDRDGVVAVLASLRRERSRIDAIEVRAMRRLRELESVGESEPAETAVASASDGDRRHASSVSDRNELCLAAPDVEDALADGALSGGHLDAMNAACRHLPDEVRAEFLTHTDDLAQRAGHVSLDSFRRECRRLAKHLLAQSHRGSEVDELELQRQASKVTRWTDRATGMCSTLIEVDPVRDVEMSSAVRAEIARLRRADGNGELTWKQLEVQAWVNCVAGLDTLVADPADPEAVEPHAPPPRRSVDRAPQVIAVADVELLRAAVDERPVDRGGGMCETSDGVDVPVETLRRWCCDAEIIPVVMDGPSRVLDEGRSKRTATVEQKHALRAMHARCAFPGCDVGFESTRIHHVEYWTRDVGPTDIANLLPVCERDHHRVHEGGWTITLDPDRTATWTRPDGVVHHIGPTTDRRTPPPSP